jgi:glycosyltransferase involved in cell wall biosynthesis
MASRGSFVRKAAILSVGRALGATTIVHLHGGGFDLYASDGPRFLQRAIRHTFESSDRVFVLSEAWRLKLRTFGGDANVAVLPNPVAVPPLRVEPRAGVLYAGRLSAGKGVLDLIEAIEILQIEAVDVHWVLAGDEPDGRIVPAVSGLPDPSAVWLPGWLDAPALDELMWSSAVFCLPSHAEGSPVALLEAMSREMACVVTPVGGVPDMVVDGSTAVVIPVGDARAIAEAVRRLVSDPELCVRLGQAARRTVVDRNELEVVVCLLVEQYCSLGFEPEAAT